jgi:DNA primase
VFSEEVIQKVKEQNDIVDVVSDVVRLKRSGRNYSGVCPFHNEKTPSFTVSRDKQIYKCFGCGEAGNVISFVMKTKNLTFPESVKVLAERVGIDVEDSNENKEQRSKYERMYRVNVEAARYFYDKLRKDENAYSYFKNRGIDDATMKKFGLGFALDGWHNLRNYLKSKNIKEEEMLNLGLTVKSPKGSIYDRFRNRVMFPVFDYSGKVIGFGGRVLDDSKPKYLNSPETPLFKKGTNLYGLNFAIKKDMKRTVILVEGYMDCIALHQHGITNVVATLGTALTEYHGKLLKRYVDKVIISFDADIAGQNATLRGLEILKKEGFEIRILQVPQGKDPDEYIKANGSEAFLKLVDNALPLIDFRLKKAENGINFSNKEMIIKYVNEVALILSSLNSIEREVYVRQVSQKTGISEEGILEEIREILKKTSKNEEKHNINVNFGQKLYLEPAYVKGERTLLKLMVSDKENFRAIVDHIKRDDFIMESHKLIYDLVIEYDNLPYEEKVLKIDTKCAQDNECTKEWINIQELQVKLKEYDVEKMIHDCIREIKKFKLEESKKEIMNKIRMCESKGLVEESIKLAQELIDIQKEIGNI